MRRITSCCIFIVLALLMSGCDNNKQNKNLKELEMNLTEEMIIDDTDAKAICQVDTDMNTNKKIVTGAKFVIFAENGIVTKVTGMELAESHDSKMLRDMRNNIEKNYKVINEKYGGYEFDIKLDGIRLTVETTIDYKQVDFEKWVTDNPDLMEFLTPQYQYQLSSIIEMYEASGLACSEI